MIVTGVAVVTLPGVTVKVAEVAFCAIVTVAGTPTTDEPELLSDTVTAPALAGSVRVTIPVDCWPL